MTLRLTNGTVDPNYRLAAGDAERLLEGHDPREAQIEAINEVIEDFAQSDPTGYSDHEARRLARRVAKLLTP